MRNGANPASSGDAFFDVVSARRRPGRAGNRRIRLPTCYRKTGKDFRLTLVVVLHLVATTPVLGADKLELQGSVERITSDAGTISGFDSILEVTDAGLGAEFHIARIVLTESGRTFDECKRREIAVFVRLFELV